MFICQVEKQSAAKLTRKYMTNKKKNKKVKNKITPTSLFLLAKLRGTGSGQMLFTDFFLTRSIYMLSVA